MAKREAVIDGDILLYRAASSVEVEIDWGNDFWTLHSYLPGAIKRFEEQLHSILDHLKTSTFILCYSSGVNFRKSVFPDYKRNRAKTRKPTCYRGLVEWMVKTYPTLNYLGLEADDCMGILATEPRASARRVVVTVDKDLRTVPGQHFNPSHPENGIARVTDEEADRRHLFQTLTGDSTDGYPGCPGIGPVKAEAILAKSPTWEAVVAAYAKAGFTEEDALVQARVARILRFSEFDPKTKGPILWDPK